MKSIGRVQSIVIAAVVGLAVLAGGWFGLVKPKKDDVTKTKAAAADQQAANQQLQLQVSMLKSMARQLPKQQAELLALQQKVPNQAQLSQLLRQLVAAAKSSGVTLTAFTPQQPQDLTGAPGVRYVDLAITFTGGYADVVSYDSALESLSRTLMVKDFTLAGASGSGSGASASGASSTSAVGTVTATFNGRVLVRADASSNGSGTAGTSTGSSAQSSTTG